MIKLIAGISLLASLPLLADLTLAENGKSAYVIAIPVQPGGYEKRFAEEFRQNFARMTGAELPIRKENEIPAGTPRIAVGKTELAKKNGVFRPDQDPEELIVRTVGRDLILAGGSAAGTGFAVYDFLERQGGCRWYDDQNIVIPRCAAFRIAELNVRRSPSFRFRRIFMLARNWEMKQVTLSLPMKLSYNSTGAPVYGAPSDIHTFYLYCKNWPKDRLYLLAKTPEGRRQALRGQLGPNFCMTHPESLERFKKQLREFIAADRKKCKRLRIPPPWLYNLSRNDGSQYFCRCEKCKAISDKLGESGLMLWFINQLAEDIAGDYPDILLQTSASSFTSAPPKGGIKAAPNLVVEPAAITIPRSNTTAARRFRSISRDGAAAHGRSRSGTTGCSIGTLTRNPITTCIRSKRTWSFIIKTASACCGSNPKRRTLPVSSSSNTGWGANSWTI